MIYFIQPENEPVVKIGYAKEIKKRLIQLQISNYQKLRLILLVSGDLKKESHFHFMFKDDKINGEWFYLSENIKKYLEQSKNIDLRHDYGYGEGISEDWRTKKLRLNQVA